MISDLTLNHAFTVTGKPTVSVTIKTNRQYSASVPFGTSTGANEACHLPLEKVQKVFPLLKKQLAGQPADFQRIDSLVESFDGTNNFSRVGANLSLAISIAAARAQTNSDLYGIGKPKGFPLPVINAIGGGLHGGNTVWQEFLMIPQAKSPQEAYGLAVQAYSEAKQRLERSGLLTGMNREHALTTKMNDEETLDFLSKIAEQFSIRLGVDCAASSFHKAGSYLYGGKALTAGQQVDRVVELAKRFNLLYIEDPLNEDDFASFSGVTKKLSNRMVVGDDIYCTNQKLLERGIEQKSSNAIIIKPDQIGNLTKTIQVISLAQKHNMKIIPSHRSNETTDDWLADIAVAFNAPYIKIGIGYDVSKHNRLMQIFARQ